MFVGLSVCVHTSVSVCNCVSVCVFFSASLSLPPSGMSVSLCMYTRHRAQEEARGQPRVSVLAFHPSCNRILFTAAWMSIWTTSFHLGTGKLGLELWHPAVRWFPRPLLRPSCLHSEYLTPETPPLTFGEPPLLTSASPMTSCCYVEKKASRKIYCLWLYSHYSFQMISFSFFLKSNVLVF